MIGKPCVSKIKVKDCERIYSSCPRPIEINRSNLAYCFYAPVQHGFRFSGCFYVPLYAIWPIDLEQKLPFGPLLYRKVSHALGLNGVKI